MAQDNKKSFVMYQGDGSNNAFSVPMTKGKYGTISVAFVRRGLDQYEYNPDTWGLNGGLFAWDSSGTKVYTDTATPAIGAAIYDQYGVDTGDTVTAVGGATITVNTDVYTRDTLHDVVENTVLTWTGDTLQIGDYIVIERTTTRTQPFEFQNNQKHIEKSDDNLERQIQEVADKVDNALLVDPTHVIDSNKMNPVEWMETILRSVDKSVRGFRYLNGWLDYSLDDPNIADVDKTWTHLVNTDNIKAIREQSRIENNETIYYTEYLAQDGSWKTLSDPHKWDNMTLADLADTDFTNLSAGNFIMFDGLKWKNVYSSAAASWGTLIGNIDDQTDLKARLDGKLNLDGSSTMTGVLKMRATSSFQCAIAPFWDGVGFYKLNSDDSVTLIASIETPDGFVPWTTNTYNIGSSLKKWKNLYLSGKLFVSTINNGGDLTVPANTTGTLATKADVDLAANSGDQLTEKGVWYAKMYSATVAPSAEDGTDYADFSQTDGQGNPIIVIYKRQNGAWVQDQTITPPAEYNGYVPVTSKIWDIVEQSGQQGGKILWSHNQKTFTPSPLIISFEDIEITGDSTVIMPQNPDANQIVNKDYVDEAIAAIPTPTVDIKQSIDAEIVGTLTVADNGDVSGFGNSNYLRFPGDVDMTGANSFEIVASFTTTVSGLTVYLLAENPVSILSDKHLTFMASTHIRFDVNDGSNYQTLEGITSLSANTKYYAKLTYDGTNYTLSLSTDGINYTTEATAAAQYIPGKITYEYLIGRESAGTQVHLSNYYIKKDGILVWQGLGDPGLHQRVSKAEADYVVESQFPTAENNLTWYRKYKSGWVEQGQYKRDITKSQANIVTLPVPMADTHFGGIISCSNITYGAATTLSIDSHSTTQVNLWGFTGAASSTIRVSWEVKGIYAQ